MLFQIRSGKKPDDVGVMQACLDGWGRTTHALICRRRGNRIASSSIVKFSGKENIFRGFYFSYFSFLSQFLMMGNIRSAGIASWTRPL